MKSLKLGAFVLALAAATPSQALTSPATMFDLSHFKLTLPVNSTGGTTGTAATIRTKELVGYPGYASEYFQTGALGTLEFFSPTNGATTSGSSSSHTRSELRELYTATGPTEWTNRIGGTLTATCRIRQASVNSDEAVIGQIHGLSSILVLIDYNPRKQQVEAKVYSSPSNSQTTVYPMKTNVAIGDRIAYSVQWIGSTLSVTVNGATRNWTTASNWNNVPVYFKLGAYSSAPNTGNPASDATKVSFERFYVQH